MTKLAGVLFPIFLHNIYGKIFYEEENICASLKCHCRNENDDIKKIDIKCKGILFDFLPLFPEETKKLSLVENHLSTLRSNSFLNLTTLAFLALSRNYLENLEDGAFEGLINLEILDLSGNKLKMLSNKAFKGLISLHTLDLSENQLLDWSILDVEHGSLRYLPNLRKLNISKNQFSKITVVKVVLPSRLKFLSMADNKVGKFSDHSFSIGTNEGNIEISYLSNLNHLNISKCGAILTDQFLDKIKNLITVDISFNRISSYDILKKYFSTSYRMEVLKMENLTNFRSKIWDIFPLPIRSLDVSNLGLDFINLTCLSYVSNLSVLRAENNDFWGRFPHNLNLASNVLELRLSGNHLKEFFNDLNEIRYSKLELLDVSSNDIKKIGINFATHFPNLKILILSKNNLRTIDWKISRLSILNLNSNSLTHIDRNLNASSIYASQNRLIRISSDFFENRFLNNLDLSQNPNLCSTDQCDVIGGTENLVRLNMANTGMQTLPPKIFRRRLRHVDFSMNSFTTFSLDQLFPKLNFTPCLNSVNFSYNLISRINNFSFFEENPCLKELDLSANPFICDCQFEKLIRFMDDLDESDFVNDFGFQVNYSAYYCLKISPQNGPIKMISLLNFENYQRSSARCPMLADHMNNDDHFVVTLGMSNTLIFIFITMAVFIFSTLFYKLTFDSWRKILFTKSHNVYRRLRLEPEERSVREVALLIHDRHSNI
uniref:Uncharacterized protein n=1 Tax=Romanomermis culicivorax TaxID=13658 RepID=A0A915JEC0_ROMCU